MSAIVHFENPYDAERGVVLFPSLSLMMGM
jgi:hypothetical protein